MVSKAAIHGIPTDVVMSVLPLVLRNGMDVIQYVQPA